MPSFLKSLLGLKQPKKQMAVAVPGKMFAWKAGCWLEATETTVFLLPGQLIQNDEKIGSIIQTSSNDALIGFTHDPETKNITEIRLKLEAGQSATVRRSTQAMMVADDQRERNIYISFEGETAANKMRAAARLRLWRLCLGRGNPGRRAQPRVAQIRTCPGLLSSALTGLSIGGCAEVLE